MFAATAAIALPLFSFKSHARQNAPGHSAHALGPVLRSTIDELQNQPATEELALELENLDNQKNLLEVFGSALYREKMPNGRYKLSLIHI